MSFNQWHGGLSNRLTVSAHNLIFSKLQSWAKPSKCLFQSIRLFRTLPCPLVYIFSVAIIVWGRQNWIFAAEYLLFVSLQNTLAGPYLAFQVISNLYLIVNIPPMALPAYLSQLCQGIHTMGTLGFFPARVTHCILICSLYRKRSVDCTL